MAPILFLVFNRPDTTRKVFQRIREHKPNKLYIAADGPRLNRENEHNLCSEVRSITEDIDWDCEVHRLYRTKNLGCGPAVSSAIDWFFDKEEWGIILEDDCLPSLQFFDFCNTCLELYRDNNIIMHVSGNNYTNINYSTGQLAFFSNYPHIWGWATWRRAWSLYSYKIEDGIDSLMSNRDFNWEEKRYWKKIYRAVVNGKINTWDYQWLFTLWKYNGIAISPVVNMVENIGITGSSTHEFLRDTIRDRPYELMDLTLGLPSDIVIDTNADKLTFKNVYSRSPSRLYRLIKENGLAKVVSQMYKRITKK